MHKSCQLYGNDHMDKRLVICGTPGLYRRQLIHMSIINNGTCAETNPRNGRTETSVHYKSCPVAQLEEHLQMEVGGSSPLRAMHSNDFSWLLL